MTWQLALGLFSIFIILASIFRSWTALIITTVIGLGWVYGLPQVDININVGGSLDGIGAFFLAFAFLFSGAWVWLWFGAYFIFGSCFWYNDRIPNGIWLTGGATVLWFILWPHSWGTFREHMFQLLVYAIPSYLALGTVWSFYKWSMTMREMRDQIVEAMEKMKKAVAARELELKKPDRDQNSDIKYTGNKSLESWLRAYPADTFLTDAQIQKQDFIPSIKKGEGRNKITNWILFWPWSVFNYIFGKLLHDLLNLIVDAFAKVYTTLSHAILKDLKDLSQPQEP